MNIKDTENHLIFRELSVSSPCCSWSRPFYFYSTFF